MIKNIIIINQNSGYLMIDIANMFDKAGYSVILITGKIVSRNRSLNDSIKVVPIVQYNKHNSVKRLITWLVGFIQILYNLKLKYRKELLLIVSNPPFTSFIPIFTKNSFMLLIYDLYPDILREMHYISNNSVINKLWENANRLVFSKAHRIFTLTEGMKYATTKYVSSDNISIVPVWSNNEFLKPINKDHNIFLKKYAIHDNFIVMYSGNLGSTHEVDAIIEVAKIIQKHDLLFVIIGEGENKKIIQRKIIDYRLENCLTFPFQEAKLLPHSLSSADIGVVTLSNAASNLSVPSKTYNFMSVGVPLLCIAGEDSELRRLVDKYELGACFEKEQVIRMKDFILDLYHHPEKQAKLSENALKASKDFGDENVLKFLPKDDL